MVKRKDEKVVTFDYDELSGYSDTVCELIPLSQREISILVSCLRVAGWTARWFGGDKLLREIGRFTDLENALTYIERLERKLLTVGCLEGLIAVMGDIRDALRAQVLCCQQGNLPIQMIDIGDGELAYGTQQPLTEPPEGEFADESEYLAHRCAAANAIVSDIISGLNQWAIVTLATITLGGFAILAIAATPPVAIFYALLVAGFGFAACELMSNYIDDNRQELVCLLFNSTSYSEWQIAYMDYVDSMQIELEISGFEINLTEFFKSIVTTDAYNKMMTALFLPVADNPVDCDSCAPSDEITVTIGTVTDGALSGGNFTLQADGPKTFGPDTYWDIAFATVSGDSVEMTFGLTGFTQPSFTSGVYENSVAVWESTTEPPPSPSTGDNVYLVSSTSFTVEVDYTFEV